MVILTAFHGRPKISRAWLEHTQGFGQIYAACSVGDTESVALCEEYGVTFIVVPNNPVSFKWQAGMGIVPPDERVMILGSDDFISREWWDMTCDHPADLVVPLTLSFWEPATGKACILTGNPMGVQAFGAGRVLSPHLRQVVDPMWPFEENAGLDSMAMAACRAAGFAPVTLATERVPVCDVKTDANIWKFGQGWWMRKAAPCSPEEAAWMLDRKSLTACS